MPYVMAAITNAAGIVSTQAQTTRLATSQRTADSRRDVPTPTIEPVIVCVVDTGIPAADVANSVSAPALSAQTPPTGWSRVIFGSHRLHDAPSAGQRPERDRRVCAQHDPDRHASFGGSVAPGDEERQDDAHGLLGVVGAVAEAVRRRRHELAVTEASVQPLDPGYRCVAQKRSSIKMKPNASPSSGASTMNTPILRRPLRHEHAGAALGDRRARHAADQRVRRRARDAEPERDQVPARSRPSGPAKITPT